ncbi:MAG TPA: Ig-like domain-containing protein [Povalibacter sp.]|uniref:Ig-like domain-containing protein n=1 Tax=Povalibacter sp. TaxID=1962978 RepID=UPI002CBF243D|nr:Ig-like domain-containing protein [Povalibacter sp.]HMN45837.1 Ig-like domain-containing protein [Povalibacter sp.]
MISRFLKLMPFMLLLGACGGSGGKPPPSGDGGTGGTGGGTTTAATLSVTTSAPTMPGDGSASATITAYARDANNALIAGVPVTFSASSGGIAGSPAVTGANGQATATLSPAGDATPRTITVTAASGSLTATVNVQVVAGGTTSVQMGSGTGAQFQSGIIAVSSGTLSAGGSTSLQIVLQQSDGTLYTQPATVSFSSPCAAQGLATITSPVQTSTGIASSTYAASGCSGDDAISATATIGGTPLSAAGSVRVAQAAIGSIVFESATPTNIALRGTGDSSRPETSVVVFRVLDQTSGPRAGAQVQFSLNTTVGGISLSPVSATSDSTGRVQTVVQGGTVATSVRVTATVLSTTPTISTQSSQLTVTTGIPDQDSFSMAVTCPNVDAWNLDGTTVPVSVRLSDRFNNPVPDGTAVTFTTEGGRIQSQCTTGTVSGESGVCSVNWTSSNPRPSDGRSSLLATAIGEESFTDVNGNGSFDNGESFQDLGERYRDDNENLAYDVGEVIYDFNNNSTRDSADGIFNGVLCLDTSGRCDPARQTTGISASNVIVMSDNTPAGVVPASGSTVGPIAAGATNNFSFLFADVNGNPLPAETTIAASISGTGLALGTPSSFRVPCTRSATSYSFSITAAPTAADGTLTILVTTPGGLQTQLTYPVDVQ